EIGAGEVGAGEADVGEVGAGEIDAGDDPPLLQPSRKRAVACGVRPDRMKPRPVGDLDAPRPARVALRLRSRDLVVERAALGARSVTLQRLTVDGDSDHVVLMSLVRDRGGDPASASPIVR